MLKRLLWLSLLLFVLLLAGYLASLHLNNRNIPYPERAELGAAFENGTAWLVSHREMILDTKNPMLWWMLKYAADISDDSRLQELVDSYRNRYHRGQKRSPWYGFFHDNSWVPVQYEDISNIFYYNKHAIAARYCDHQLLSVPEIAMQNDPDFCSSAGYWYRPACATHQLMGLRFLEMQDCQLVDALDETIRSVEERIARQATWDTRVVDVYLQRVLMLAESGRPDLLRASWIQRILDHQQEDGGWTGTVEIIKLPGPRSLVFSSSRPLILEYKSNFHATAQAVLLMALLVSRDYPPGQTGQE